MKKIVHVQVIPKMSGVQMVSYDIFSNLSNDEFEKFLICSADEAEIDFFEKFESIGVKIIKIPELKRSIGFHDFKAFLKFFFLFSKYRFDIVHTNSTKPGIIARVAAKLAGVPKVIHTVHGIAYHEFEPLLKRIFYYLVEMISSFFSNYIVLVNEYYGKYYSFLPFVKVVTIYNGVDFEKLDVKRNKSDVVNILFLARLDRQKNPLQLIRAIEYIKNNNLVSSAIPYQVTIAGDGSLRRECEDYTKEHDLLDTIKFTGWCKNKSQAYNNADIFCVPSLFEAFGLVFIESAYFGIPTVSTIVEGIPEVVSDNNTGLLVEPNSISQLAESLASLINDPAKRKLLGEKARIRSHQFSVDKMVDSYKQLYLA